ncbi:hypothetical protein DFH05DRAFT_1557274 [Lentinula detonsa]|uniref:Carbohydrate esterase 2 N-terminal domain-containing protein n=1 Tax=Lentinula detonsa TaxID=2804962 RepID=A0A9W8P1N5_9AGAR|nr:hypothetical protein DFH05DRAFT_1557274 [Lentinula detonsa]
MSTTWFMVDDTDPRLNYIGSWSSLNIGNFTEGLDLDESSRTGPVYNNTLHYTTGNDTVSFRFNGSSYLGVYGTQDGTIANGQLPEIECTLDGAPTWSFVDEYPEGLTNNNMLACRADSRIGGSSPGEHELLINVTNYSNSDWYFDYITFESLVDPVLDGEVLQAGNAELIDASNYSVLTFGAGWTTDSDDSTVTSIPGSQATLKFNGTSVSLYGDLRNVSNTAAYQIDDQEPVTVQLPATVSQEAKQLLFTAQRRRTHRIIIGAVLGSVTAILLLILAVTLLLRKRRQVRLEAATPFEYSGLTTTPFQYQDRVHGPNPGEGSLSYVTQSKINSDTTALSPLRAEGMSTQANSGGNGDSTNALTNLKLQQRLIILQEEISRRDRQFAEGSTQQERLLTVHTDSGLRLAGEDTLGINREMVEVPPGYTAD